MYQNGSLIYIIQVLIHCWEITYLPTYIVNFSKILESELIFFYYYYIQVEKLRRTEYNCIETLCGEYVCVQKD